MPHEYSAENHDWDLTLRSAWELLQLGQAMQQMATTGNIGKGFPCFTGSMLLLFCAIESFSASVAFSMPKETQFQDFDFEKYRGTFNFWGKLEILFSELDYRIDKSEGLFQKISKMQQWRNLVTHASPYEISNVSIKDTVNAPRNLQKPYHSKQYTRSTKVTDAKEFYTAAYDYIDLVKNLSGINPRAMVIYTIGNSSEDT